MSQGYGGRVLGPAWSWPHPAAGSSPITSPCSQNTETNRSLESGHAGRFLM